VIQGENMRGNQLMRVFFMVCLLTGTVQGYSGGSGTSGDPYQLSTPQDLVDLSEADADWDKDFALTSHIDVAGIPWDRAVIPEFSGRLYGNGFVVRNLAITGGARTGLIGMLNSGYVEKLGVEDANIVSTGDYVGIVVGDSSGQIYECYSTGKVTGKNYVGGVVGQNDGFIDNCYSEARVTGNSCIGGLIGLMNHGFVFRCYSTGFVVGDQQVGGLVGCQSKGSVKYSMWDVQTSGQVSSAGDGWGLTTNQMMDAEFFGLSGWAGNTVWTLNDGHDYPRLSWQDLPGQIIGEPQLAWIEGTGKPDDPFVIVDANQLLRIHHASVLRGSHFELGANIDLSGFIFKGPILPTLSGNFNGNGYEIRNMTIQGSKGVGFIGRLQANCQIRDLGIVDASVVSTDSYAGILVNTNNGFISRCYTTGSIRGSRTVGGLVAFNASGGLIHCRSQAVVDGGTSVGGLVGYNKGQVIQCYSGGIVTAEQSVGGLAGINDSGYMVHCYSTCKVVGREAGGCASEDRNEGIIGCFWDTQTSGQISSAGGTGMNTDQMHDAQTYVDAGWDFAAQEEKGLCRAWRMKEAGGYPVLSVLDGCEPWPLTGDGTRMMPYEIGSPNDLAAMVYYDLSARYELTADIDLSGTTRKWPLIPWLSGSLNGNGFTIKNMNMTGVNRSGLVGHLTEVGHIKNLGVLDANIVSTGIDAGLLVGLNKGFVTQCFTTGTISGASHVGGLVGTNDSGQVCYSYNTGMVAGVDRVGGLVGSNEGQINACFSTGLVMGTSSNQIGGLVGDNSDGSLPIGCFWDTETSGQSESHGGMGKATAQMMNNQT
jgi:hypothetical protein